MTDMGEFLADDLIRKTAQEQGRAWGPSIHLYEQVHTHTQPSQFVWEKLWMVLLSFALCVDLVRVGQVGDAKC